MWLLALILVLFVVALALTSAIVATQLRKKTYPPQPAPPVLSGWYYTGVDSAWASQTFYRCAYVDVVARTQGAWSDSSLGVLSFGAALPIMQIIPTGTTGVVWQRKLEGGTWTSAALAAVKENGAGAASTGNLSDAAALTLAERAHSALWIDMINPAATTVSRPSFAPFPSVSGAGFVDERGLTWAREDAAGHAWPATRFASRFVGAEPGPWSAWSDAVWLSDVLSGPTMQVSWSESLAVQVTGSWFHVDLSASVVAMSFSKEHAVATSVRVALAPGRSTIDAVLRAIERACFVEAGAPVQLSLSLESSQVTFELLPGEPTPHLPAVTSFTMFVNSPDSVFRALGFTQDICCGQPGTVYRASSAPALAYEPVLVDSSVVVVL